MIHDQVDANLKANKVPDEMYRRLMAYTDAASAALATGKPVPPNPPKELASLFNPYGEKLMRAYHTVDPLALAANYAGPVLVANGAADAQVSAVKDAPLLVGVFKKRAKGTVELRIVPKASHCFKESADAFSGPVVPGLLDGVAGFLRREL